MKKIIHLVAPLMVMPFLLGCNNAKQYNVSVLDWNSKNITFTNQQGKEFTSGAKVTDGKDFTFHIVAKKQEGITNTVFDEGLFIFVSGTPYLGEYSFTYDDTTYTSATIKLPGANVKGDIALAGAEWKEGYYVCEFPYIVGTRVESIVGNNESDVIGNKDDYYVYLKSDAKITITFELLDDGKLPGEYDIALGVDTDHIYNISEVDWATYNPGDGKLVINNGESYPVDFNLVIMARGKEVSVLDYLSWNEIKLISEWGYGETFFYLGDEKTIKINNKDHVLRIIGFDHAEDTKGTIVNYGITFQFKTLISDESGVSFKTHWSDTPSSSTANYDFVNSTLNLFLKNQVFNALPDDLKAEGMIKTVTKKVGIYNSGWKAETYQTQLFPLSQIECSYESASYDVADEGTVYEYYNKQYAAGTLNTSRTFSDATGGSAQYYWLRSPRTGVEGTTAYAVTDAGEIATDGRYCRTHLYGMAPAFVI